MADGVRPESIKGKDKILMFRKYGDKVNAGKLALQTNHEIGSARSVDATQTKDGAEVQQGGLEQTISIEAVASRDPLNLMLEDSVVEGYMLEVWEIDIAGEPNEAGKFPARYGVGYLDEWTVPADVEELSTVSTNFTVNGKLVNGFATLTEEQQAIISYVFRDTTAEDAVDTQA